MKSKRTAVPAKPVDKVDVLAVLFQRYARLARENSAKLDQLPLRCQTSSVLALCSEGEKNGADYPFDKMNRWVGFLQGVLAAVGALDMDDEREFTRPLLRQLHDGPTLSFPRVKKISEQD